VTDPRQAGKRCALPEQQIAHGPRREVGTCEPVTDIAASDDNAGAGAVGDACRPVAGHPKHARPGVVQFRLGESGKELEEACRKLPDRLLRSPAVAVEAQSEVVGNAPATERDPSVGGALEVGEAMRHVAEKLTSVPSDRLKLGVGERLGHDHAAIHRQQTTTPNSKRKRNPSSGGC